MNRGAPKRPRPMPTLKQLETLERKAYAYDLLIAALGLASDGIVRDREQRKLRAREAGNG